MEKRNKHWIASIFGSVIGLKKYEIKIDNKDLIYKISQGFDITIDNEIQNYIANNWDTIQEKAEKIKENKKELDMLAVQGKNVL